MTVSAATEAVGTMVNLDSEEKRDTANAEVQSDEKETADAEVQSTRVQGWVHLSSLNDLDWISLKFDQMNSVQGDHSRCSQPPVDTKPKVAFHYMGLILKQNFCFDVRGRLGKM